LEAFTQLQEDPMLLVEEVEVEVEGVVVEVEEEPQ
jgi:hypothetical protein